MAKKEKPELLENIVFFNISFRFLESDTNTHVKDVLSKLKLLDFKDITVDYNIERISIIEELLPEAGITPNLTLVVEDFEIFLSKKKITLSYPKDLERSGRTLYRSKDLGMRIMPSFPSKREKKKESINFTDLDKVDLLLKMFILPEILEEKIPKSNELSVILGIEINKPPKIESINRVIEEKFLETKKFILEDINFEIDDEENKYFFSLRQDNKSMLCSFIYPNSDLSIVKSKIKDILVQNYNKFNELMGELKII